MSLLLILSASEMSKKVLSENKAPPNFMVDHNFPYYHGTTWGNMHHFQTHPIGHQISDRRSQADFHPYKDHKGAERCEARGFTMGARQLTSVNIVS